MLELWDAQAHFALAEIDGPANRFAVSVRNAGGLDHRGERGGGHLAVGTADDGNRDLVHWPGGVPNLVNRHRDCRLRNVCGGALTEFGRRASRRLRFIWLRLSVSGCRYVVKSAARGTRPNVQSQSKRAWRI
jgi:hypothetical protein